MSTPADPYYRLTQPYFCAHCMKRSAFPLISKAGGFACPLCLGVCGPFRKPAAVAITTPAAPKRRRRRRKIAKRLRQWSGPLLTIAERDGWICWLCGQEVDRDGPWEHRPSVDHVHRRRDGGLRSPDNLRLAHQSCNEYREGANVTPFAPPLGRSQGVAS